MNRQTQVNTTHIKARSEENENKCFLSLSNAVCSSEQLISAQPTNIVDGIKQWYRFII